MTILLVAYSIILVGLALYGFNTLIYSILFLKYRNVLNAPYPEPMVDFPTVTVQLPMYNERLVVEHLIDSIAALDYPADKLSIQVLDDSSDETMALARARVAFHQAHGIDIEYVRRPQRQGFKAGALAYGLQSAKGEFIAMFDADFSPPRDFLQKLIPHFSNPKVGMVQARWGHLNADKNPFTRAQALMLDGHFVVEQTVRSQSGLLMNFNGSGGVWRRACIDDAGGWQDDTIAEDLDLSYRAQLAGWKMAYLPSLVAPAEIPPLLTAFKRQQFRWAKGAIQSLRKFAAKLLRAPLSPWQKTQAFLHLSGYIVHPLMLLMIILGLPVILSRDPGTLPLSALGIAGFAPPILFALSQWGAYKNWMQRIAYFPFLIMFGAGITLNNSWAVFEGLTGRNAKEFLRTPKFSVGGLSTARDYILPIDWTTWGELLLAIYCWIEAYVAIIHAPGLMPFLVMYALGFSVTAGVGLWQSGAYLKFGQRKQPRRNVRHSLLR